MTESRQRQAIGAWRFQLFIGTLILGGLAAIPSFGWSRGFLAAFDGAALLFIISIGWLLRTDRDAAGRRARAGRNDANRWLLLAISGVVSLAVLVAVGVVLAGRDDSAARGTLVLATLVLAWLFSNLVYALHYAHVFYRPDAAGADGGGLDFPGTDEPDYWDFIYFAFTLGMTFQTSDVAIRSRHIRRVVTFHCLAAFVFNLGVIAFVINTLGG